MELGMYDVFAERCELCKVGDQWDNALIVKPCCNRGGRMRVCNGFHTRTQSLVARRPYVTSTCGSEWETQIFRIIAQAKLLPLRNVSSKPSADTCFEVIVHEAAAEDQNAFARLQREQSEIRRCSEGWDHKRHVAEPSHDDADIVCTSTDKRAFILRFSDQCTQKRINCEDEKGA